jgi:phospholipase C
VNADGSPGPQSSRAQQFHISAINPVRYFIDTNTLTGSGKAAYAPNLPTPEAGGAPPAAVTLSQFLKDPAVAAPPFDGNTFSAARLHQISPVLRSRDLPLLTTGATGLHNCTADATEPPSPCAEPDTRVTHFNALPNTVFQITGPRVAYDSYTGDMVHRFFHMWQQSDCNVSLATADDPAGCRNDLYPYVGIARGDDSGANSMGFYNVQSGDAPLFKRLADEYTMSDNYHQPVMGGTGPDSVPLGFADQVFFTDGTSSGGVGTPPATQVYNPNPQITAYSGGNFNLYTSRKQWFNCSDPTAPGVKPILDYLQKLPYEVDPKCQAGAFYNAVNVNPAWTPGGAVQTGTIVPVQTNRSIGDVLTAHNIPWKYYGGGYNLSVAGNPINGYCNICNPFEFQANYPAMRADHMRDVTDLFTDIKNGTLPAVSYVKPDGAMDGHPASSKFNIFEAFAGNIIDLVKANPQVWNDTAIFVTVDEGGGYYDSGFIQWVDFFGTGPRIPMIAVSPFSVGGHVSHVYNEHSSFVKFVERNWKLGTTLTARSRDNLPNPVHSDNGDADDYVPRNMPAIGDLFDMFNFGRDDNDNQGDD